MDDEGHVEFCRLGPADLREAFLWPYMAMRVLCGIFASGVCDDPASEQEDNLQRLLILLGQYGLEMTTHYSGIECPIVAVCLLLDCLFATQHSGKRRGLA